MIDDTDMDFEAERHAFQNKVEQFLASTSREEVDRLAIASLRCLNGEPLSDLGALADVITESGQLGPRGLNEWQPLFRVCDACCRNDAISPRTTALVLRELRVKQDSNLEWYLGRKDADWRMAFEDEFALWDKPSKEAQADPVRALRILALPAGEELLSEIIKRPLVPKTLTPDDERLVRAALESPNPSARKYVAMFSFAPLPLDCLDRLFNDDRASVRLAAAASRLHDYWKAGPLPCAKALLHCAKDPDPRVVGEATEHIVYSPFIEDQVIVLLNEEIRRQGCKVPPEFAEALAERMGDVKLSMHERLDVIFGAYPSPSAEKDMDASPSCVRLDKAGPEAPLLAGLERLDREPVNPLARASSKAKDGPER